MPSRRVTPETLAYAQVIFGLCFAEGSVLDREKAEAVWKTIKDGHHIRDLVDVTADLLKIAKGEM